MRTLLIAAGGGGDVLGAQLVRSMLAPGDDSPMIATYAWERLRVDPVPGPRGINGFVDLGVVGDQPMEVLPTSDTRPAGYSTLPKLAEYTGARLFVLDPYEGAAGMRAQVDHLVDVLNIARVVVVDVGGDAVARGDEPALLSPLADVLALASCANLSIPVQVAVAGPGVDGEIGEDGVLDSLREINASRCGVVSATDVDAVGKVLEWHPSEATALLAAAASNVRGVVEIRRHSITVPLTNLSATVWIASFEAVRQHSLIVDDLYDTQSLEEAEVVVRRTTISELDRERKRAVGFTARSSAVNAPPDTAARVLDYANNASARGVDLITTRRLVEAIDLPHLDATTLRDALALSMGEAMRGPLWDLTDLTGMLRSS